MHDNQYALFQELDRRCVARGFEEHDCTESVRLKRASIDLETTRGNPLARDVLSGRTTLVATYDEFSRTLRGVRRFLPLSHDAARNERLRDFAKIVPNVRHFTRRSVFALDNPVTAGIYGWVAAAGIVQVLGFVLRSDVEEGSAAPAAGSMGGWVMLGFTLVGLLAGSLAMIRYRTRDPKEIHAREAAAYMDVNYEFYARGDDRAWAAFIRRPDASTTSRITTARAEAKA